MAMGSAGGAYVPSSAGNPQTIASPTLTSPTISGTTVIGAGATITTPTITWTPIVATATGATGADATSLGSAYPAVVTVTGASGAGVGLPVAVAGAVFLIKNMMTGAANVYAVGSTINGTTGTTAYPITATGNRTAVAFATAAGAWQVGLNT